MPRILHASDLTPEARRPALVRYVAELRREARDPRATAAVRAHARERLERLAVDSDSENS